MKYILRMKPTILLCISLIISTQSFINEKFILSNSRDISFGADRSVGI